METIIDRIRAIIRKENLTSSAFAEKIGVQRSSISHILSGRNNPSLDFILKIIENFQGASADWLLFGRGEYHAYAASDDNESDKKIKIEERDKINKEINAQRTIKNPEVKHLQLNHKSLQRVLLIYDDGTFEHYVMG